MMISEWLLLAGSIVILVASIGVLRFPMALQKTHAVGVASTIGIGLIALGCGIHFHDPIRTALVVLFFALKGPVGSQLLGLGLHRNGKI